MISSELKVDYSKKMKYSHVWNRQEIKGAIDAHSIDSEEAKCLLRDHNKYGYCLLDLKECHNCLFSAFCFVNVKNIWICIIKLFPISAPIGCYVLHDVHIFLMYEVIANVNKSLFLSECLKQMMEKTWIVQKRNILVLFKTVGTVQCIHILK